MDACREPGSRNEPDGGDGETCGNAPVSEAERLSAVGYPLLILICGVGDATYMVLAPFFPQRAAEVGLSPTLNGLIFSCFMWGGLVVTPLATALSRKTKPRILLGTCVLLQAALTALFALAPLLTRGWQWFLLTFTLRLLQGTIAAIYEVAVSSLIMCSVDVENVGTALGVQEAARGVGLMVGPAVGGMLYAAGGFALPFLVSAGVLALLGIMVFVLLSDDEAIGDDDEVEHASFAQVLLLPAISVVTALLVALAMALSVLDPILGPWVHDQYGLSPTVIGLIFSAATLAYAGLSPAIGAIGNRLGNFTTLVGGMLISALSFFLMGPCPWVPEGVLPQGVWLLVVAMLLVGVGSSTLTCAVPCMLDVCVRGGFAIEAVSDVIGGLLSFSWSLGALVGPLYGSALVQTFGFPEATSETGVLLLVLTALGILIFQAFEPTPAVQRLVPWAVWGGMSPAEDSSGDPEATLPPCDQLGGDASAATAASDAVLIHPDGDAARLAAKPAASLQQRLLDEHT
jgi:MFS family permease